MAAAADGHHGDDRCNSLIFNNERAVPGLVNPLIDPGAGGSFSQRERGATHVVMVLKF
jgi:hypothetical protein